MKTVDLEALKQQLEAARNGGRKQQKAFLSSINHHSTNGIVINEMNDSDLQWIAPLALELFVPAVNIVACGMRQKCRHWEEDFLDEGTGETVTILRTDVIDGETVFTPNEAGEYVVNVDGCGQFELYLNGERQFHHRIWRTTPNHIVINAEKGKSYNIEVRFSHVPTYNANLAINIAKEYPIDYQTIINQLKGINKVIFVGGISPALEGEEMPVDIDGFKGGDRTHIELPKVQRDFLKALKDAGKTIIFVNCSGSCIALEPEIKTCDAIVQAWYPGQEGGTAVADVLFGDYNPSGKLPVTFYKNSNQLPDYEDYSMKGRTYRYFTDALFPFGYGLSYTNFEITKAGVEKNGTNPTDWTLTAEVANTGKRDGAEVVQVYIRNLQDADGPLKTLRGFERINVKAGETATATIQLNKQSFEFWDAESNTMRVKPGKYEILVGTSSDEKNARELMITIQ